MLDDDKISGKIASPDNVKYCKNEVEEGAIVNEEEDTKVVLSEHTSVLNVSNENHSGQSAKDVDMAISWKMQQNRQTIIDGSPFMRFKNRSKREKLPSCSRMTSKRDIGCITDDDKSRSKRRRIDEFDENDSNPMLRNNQNPELYSCDVADRSISTNEKEQSPTSSLSQLNSLVVEKVDLDQITISDDIVKLLNSMKSQPIIVTRDEQSPFHVPPVKNFEFEEIVQEKSTIEKSPVCPIGKNSSGMDSGNLGIDLRDLPFKFPLAVASEIKASLNSHRPMKYVLTPVQGSVTEYSNITPTMGIDDPRLRRNITAVTDPMYALTLPVATAVTTVRPVDPRKRAHQFPMQRHRLDIRPKNK